jgi:hypothetical protein
VAALEVLAMEVLAMELAALVRVAPLLTVKAGRGQP